MSKMEFLDPLEAEKFTKQKCIQFCLTPCRTNKSPAKATILANGLLFLLCTVDDIQWNHSVKENSADSKRENNHFG